jgi:hypothetical protein
MAAKLKFSAEPLRRSLEEAADNSPGGEAGVLWAVGVSAEGAAQKICAGPSDLNSLSPLDPALRSCQKIGFCKIAVVYFQ